MAAGAGGAASAAARGRAGEAQQRARSESRAAVGRAESSRGAERLTWIKQESGAESATAAEKKARQWIRSGRSRRRPREGREGGDSSARDEALGAGHQAGGAWGGEARPAAEKKARQDRSGGATCGRRGREGGQQRAHERRPGSSRSRGREARPRGREESAPGGTRAPGEERSALAEVDGQAGTGREARPTRTRGLGQGGDEPHHDRPRPTSESEKSKERARRSASPPSRPPGERKQLRRRVRRRRRARRRSAPHGSRAKSRAIKRAGDGNRARTRRSLSARARRERLGLRARARTRSAIPPASSPCAASTSLFSPLFGTSSTPILCTRAAASGACAASAASTPSPEAAADVVVVERDDRRAVRDLRQPGAVDVRAARAARRRRPRPRPRPASVRRAPGAADHHRARRDEEQVAALAQDRPAPGDELLDRGRLEADRPRHADEPEVDRPCGARSTAQSTAARTSCSENGSISAIPGIAPSAEMSRTDWCEWPGPPGTSPASEPA